MTMILGFGFLSIMLYNRVLASCIFFAIDRNFFKNDKLDGGKGLVVGFCKTFRIRRLTSKPRKSRYLTGGGHKTGLNFYISNNKLNSTERYSQDKPDSLNLIF
jgi:hypothetical protein